jgi:hypothetical protein
MTTCIVHGGQLHYRGGAKYAIQQQTYAALEPVVRGDAPEIARPSQGDHGMSVQRVIMVGARFLSLWCSLNLRINL